MNKTILITGGAGFIAHHVIDKILATTDWNIVTLDRLDFSGNLNRLNEVVMSHDSNQRSRVRVIHHDLKSEINPEIANTIGEIDYIAHLAAGSHVDRSITFPLEFVMDNVVGTQIYLISHVSMIKASNNLFISVQMKFLDLHLMVYHTKRMIDIIQQIHILLLKGWRRISSCL